MKRKHQCSYLLWPRLFRGVTPDRHAGETSLAVVHNWLAHSGYPLGRKQQGIHWTATTHVPYAVLLTPGSALTSFDLATRPHRTDIKVRFHVVLPEG